jgi:hypothetical protein
MLRRALIALAAVFLVASPHVVGQSAEDLLKSEEANFRVEGAKRLAAQNNRKSVEPIIKAMQIEPDGAAGREMGLALKVLTDAEAIQAVEKHRRHAGDRRQGPSGVAQATAADSHPT